jgi:hypothetical protein
MDSLFTNAVASIQLGIEDYQANDPKRSISAVRNFYAGALLLAKEVLAREAPDTNPEQILGTSYRPIPDGQGGVQYKVTSHRTIDFVEMGRRFQDFDIPVDRRALNDLNRIRNAIEHSYTNASHDTVREVIAKASCSHRLVPAHQGRPENHAGRRVLAKNVGCSIRL